MKKMCIRVVFSLWLALMLSFLPGSQVKQVFAGTGGCVLGPHHGSLITSETWCAANNPHLVDNVFTVPSGVTLTIEPGVRVEFTSGGNIGVAGSLVAIGDADHPITFTSNLLSPAPGSWQGILAVEGSSLQMSYTELAYAGQPGFAYGSLAIYTTNATVSHSRIHHGFGTGLFIDGIGTTPQFNDVEIDHYTGAAIVQNKISMNPSFANMRLHDNTTNGVLISGGTTSQNVTLDGSPAALNGAPIYVWYGFTVGGNTTVTVTPGTTLRLAEGISVASTGTLVAEGTPNEPITFSGYQEILAPGDWVGINAAPNSTLKLSYCDLNNSGKPGFWHGSLHIETSNATVRQCRIQHSSGHGIYILGVNPFPLWNNILSDIGGVALYVEGGSHLEALHTTLARNGVGLYVPNGSAVLTNTIIAGNTIGVQQANTGTITLSSTLFQDNTSPILGTITDTNHIDGSAAFLADGYHIAENSDAVDAGSSTAVNVDVDGDPRAIIFAPDLGADEYRDAIATIDNVTGGTLTYTNAQGNPTIITVPGGAVSEDTVLVLRVVHSVTPPSTYVHTGHAFHLDGYRNGIRVPGLAFLLPVSVSLHYSDADVKGMDEGSFTMWYWTGSAWSGAACGNYAHHPGENWLSVPICHLSQFSFFGQYRVRVPVIMR